MVGALARDPHVNIPISGIGGISDWRDAVEFILMGSTSVQVCTAVMHYGFRIVRDMIEGLENYMDEKGFKSVAEMVGLAARNFVEWGELDLNYRIVARIDAQKCIGCQLCYVACYDGSHQCIYLDSKAEVGPAGIRVPRVAEDECTGCNLCHLVCPVPGCITMQEVDNGRTSMSWNEFVAQGGTYEQWQEKYAHYPV
jgi:dihydropyrimidine dehydrogenase (NAD+) subunit PreA